MTRKEIYQEITNNIIEQAHEFNEIHFSKIIGKQLSYQLSIKVEYDNEYYIKFNNESYERVSENYIKEVISLYNINKINRIKKYIRDNGSLNISYKAS